MGAVAKALVLGEALNVVLPREFNFNIDYDSEKSAFVVTFEADVRGPKVLDDIPDRIQIRRETFRVVSKCCVEELEPIVDAEEWWALISSAVQKYIAAFRTKVATSGSGRQHGDGSAAIAR